MRGNLNVGFILSRNFTLSAFSLFVDTLRLASDAGDRSGRALCDWRVMSSTGHLVRSSCGVQVAPTSGLIPPQNFHYLAVVGGLLISEEPLERSAFEYVRRAAKDGVKIIGLCTGSFILASAGLLRNRTACVSWLHYRSFLERFPGQKVSSRQLYIEDKGLITCAGGSAVADLAAELVSRHVGPAAERNATEILQMDRRRNGRDIQPRNPFGTNHSDPRINAALAHMENTIESPVGVEEIAALMGLSRRQMERVFEIEVRMSPIAAYMKLRMDRAMDLVRKTPKPLVEVALDTGFENTSHFTRRFRAAFGCTPTDVRKSERAARTLD